MPPPPRRRPRRRVMRTLLTALTAVALGGWLVVHLAVAWISTHPAAVAGLVVVAGGVSYFRARPDIPGQPRAPVRARSDSFLALSAGEFEQAIAALCRRDGCTRVRVVGGAGDLAADVLATTPGGRRILIQAKRYAPGNRVGSPEVQRVGGTYQLVHRADLAIVVTTSSYTAAAEGYARTAGIRLVDGTELASWASGESAPPWDHGERRMRT